MAFMENIDVYRFSSRIKEIYQMRYSDEMTISQIAEKTGRDESDIISLIEKLLNNLLNKKG